MSDAQSSVPSSTEPTPAIDPTVTPATVPDPSPGAVPPPPPPEYNAYVAEGATPFDSAGREDAEATHPAQEFLDKIEAIAIRYGGDVMAEVRHLCAKAKSVL